MGKLIKVVVILAVLASAAAFGVWYFCPESEMAAMVTPAVEWTMGQATNAYDKAKAQLDAAEARKDERAAAETRAAAAEVVAAVEEKQAKKSAVEKPKALAASPKREETWTGLAASNWYCGKVVSPRDFRKKVTLIFVFDAADEESVKMLPRVQQLWESFKHKPFVVLGSHRGGKSAKVKSLLASKHVTFPVYEDASYVKCPRSVSKYPYLYVVNAEGRIVYRGHDERAATEAFVSAF